MKINKFVSGEIKYLLLLTFVLAITISAFFVARNRGEAKENQVEEIHYHAGFQVYVDDKLQDFSDLAYMQIEPCGEDEHEQFSEEHEQIEKAHLHDGVGDVVHVHRNGAVWRDLFTNIEFPLDPNAVVYVNGNLVEDFLNYPIYPYDSLVILSGESSEINEKLKNAVTREHIEEAEAKSESC